MQLSCLHILHIIRELMAFEITKTFSLSIWIVVTTSKQRCLKVVC